MICPACGSTIPAGATNCPNCGRSLADPAFQQNIAVSMGASKGSTAKIMGIISLFLGPIFAIIGLIFANQSKSYTGGVRNHDAQVGYVCSWICLGFYIAGIVLSIIFSIIGVGILAEMAIVPAFAAILI